MTNRDEKPVGAFERDYSDEPRQTGYVKWFDDKKGYGFIAREGGTDLFVHFTHIKRAPQTLHEYERVSFVVMPGKKGPEARDVTVIAGGSLNRESPA